MHQGHKTLISGGYGHLTGVVYMERSYKKWGGTALVPSPHFSHLWYVLTKMCLSLIEHINFGKDNLL